MFRLRYFICILALVIYTPFPTVQHFIWPLEWCLLADFCNHTWIPECGVMKNGTSGKAHFRLFIDECDMFEYNCDNNKSYDITNYSLCHGATCLDDDKKLLRIGDYQVVGLQRKLVYNPTNAWGQLIHTTKTTIFKFPTTTKPNLPQYMLKGRRRFTPYGPFWGRRYVEPETRSTRKRATRKTKKNSKRRTTRKKTTTTTTNTPTNKKVIIRKVTFKRKNKTFVRVFKGVVGKVTRTTIDDDFLE